MNWLLHGVGLWLMVGFALAGWVFAALAVAHMLSEKWYSTDQRKDDND